MDHEDGPKLPIPQVTITNRVVEKVTELLKGEPYEMTLKATPDEWERVEDILNTYLKSHSFWEGFLNSGQVQKFEKLKERSQGVLGILREIDAGGLSLLLTEHLGLDGLSNLHDLLETVCHIEVRSPKSSTTRAEYAKRHLALPKAELQALLDQWWHQTTSTKPAAYEAEGGSPFSAFLKAMFQLLPKDVRKDLGTSRTTVEERRRFKRQHDKFQLQRDKQMKAVAEKLRALEAKVSK